MVNILKEIESRYPVDKILVNGEQVWPFLRIKYFFKYIEIMSDKIESSSLRKKPFIQKLKLIKKVIYGLKRWFGKYHYIALSTSRLSVKKKINGKYYDRLIDPIIDEIGKEKFLYIERPYSKHYPLKEVHTKNIVSYIYILFLAFIIEKLYKLPKIKCISLLKLIQKDYNLKIDDCLLLRYFYAQKKVFKFIYFLLKPKIIFVVCYYDNLAAIKAAKEMGIKIIEVQHGVIGMEHSAYNIHIDLDKSYFPDFLLVFGKRDIELLRNSRFINHKNIYAVGSYYIDHIRKNYRFDIKLLEKLKQYSKCVGVTLQSTVEDRTISFIEQAAKLDDSICYILIPHPPIQRDYLILNLSDNVFIITDKDFYELMRYVDFHTTVYSTCALEAPSLGVQNIMININNLSKKYFGNVLKNNKITRYVNTPNEYVKEMNTFKKLDREKIIQLNEDIIVPNYNNNIKNFINILSI